MSKGNDLRDASCNINIYQKLKSYVIFWIFIEESNRLYKILNSFFILLSAKIWNSDNKNKNSV